MNRCQGCGRIIQGYLCDRCRSDMDEAYNKAKKDQDRPRLASKLARLHRPILLVAIALGMATGCAESPLSENETPQNTAECVQAHTIICASPDPNAGVARQYECSGPIVPNPFPPGCIVEKEIGEEPHMTFDVCCWDSPTDAGVDTWADAGYCPYCAGEQAILGGSDVECLGTIKWTPCPPLM
jgi:hypothetical protein